MQFQFDLYANKCTVAKKELSMRNCNDLFANKCTVAKKKLSMRNCKTKL
jgi:hypothetical protein